MSNYVCHSYHLVDESPWPLFSATGAFFLTSGLVKWFHAGRPTLLGAAGVVILLIMYQWWRDVSAEGSLQGIHSSIVELGLRWGIALFIISEIFFFISFFWAFFHRRLAPSVLLGRIWPPQGISPFNPWQVPLLNTLILLGSGVCVTWAHHALIEGAHRSALWGLGLTCLLGGYFTCLQGLEYFEAKFTLRDRVFGAAFFIATGFHGLHVIVGSLFLRVSRLRIAKGKLRAQHHFGLEAAAWYWHFVDVVWLFLFLSLYIWGGLKCLNNLNKIKAFNFSMASCLEI